MVPPDSRASRPYDSDFVTLQTLMRKEPEKLSARFDALFGLSEGSDVNLDRFVASIEEGLIPIIYANHLSLADKFAASLVTSYVTARVPQEVLHDFQTVVAASIDGGQQGEYVRGIGTFFEEIYKSRGYGADVAFVTVNDREQRGVAGMNRESLLQFLDAPDKKSGVLLFPEGTMQGGRMNAEGVPFGMQEVTDGGLLLAGPRRWLKSGKNSVFLPVGIVGSNAIFPPDQGKNRLSPEVMSMIKGDQAVRQLVTVSVGEPFVYSGTETPDFMMQKVASLLPDAQRGQYKRH